MIPLFHDFTDETVVVFGGGPVGARKARRFDREATVVVVSPEFSEADYGEAAQVRANPAEDEISGWVDRTDPTLAVAATNDAGVNEAIEREATARELLVNRADHSDGRGAKSVVVPATVRDGDVAVAISSGGNSPALTSELRKRIEPELEGAGELATITASVREELKAREVDPEIRRRAVRDVVQSSEVWKDLGRGDSNAHQTVDAIVESALGEKS